MDFWPNDGHFNLYNNVFVNTIASVHQVEINYENPDIIFYSLFGTRHREERYKNAVKVFFNGESYVSDPTADFIIDMDRTIHEKSISKLCTGSTNIDRRFYMPLWLYDRDFPIIYGKSRSELMEEKHLCNEGILDNKSGFCSFVASNNVLLRNNICGYISTNYKQIDCPGICMNNTPDRLDRGFIAKYTYLYDKKFNLCFENRSKPGYCTEKIVDAFGAHTIPIYWGDPYITETFNRDSFINAGDFSRFSEILERIKEIDNDDTLYTKMINTPALLDPEYPVKKVDEMKDFILNIVYNL